MNGIPKELLLSVGGALLCAFAVSFLMCPLVKSFAYKIGAIDVPKDNRRMHKKPVPRLGGLAIFLGFIVSMLLFVKVDHQLQGILLGASIIVVLGVVDDMSPLRAYFKFCVQIFAALVAVFHGVVIQASLSGTAAQFSLSPTPTSFPRQPISISAGCPSPSQSCGSSASRTPSTSSTALTALPAAFRPSAPFRCSSSHCSSLKAMWRS